MKGGKISKIFDNILLDLKNMEGVKKLALASRDGFIIENHPDENMEILTLMSATILSAAETITTKLEKVNPSRVIIDYKGGKLITTTAGPKALISIMAAQDASLEPIIDELDRTAGKIKEIL